MAVTNFSGKNLVPPQMGLRSYAHGLDNLKFPLLSHFMSTMTVLPHSSASVERIFSQINRMKTKTTNSLKAETVDNRLLAKQSIFRKKSIVL